MAGRPGRSGGHNKLSPQEHLLRGTWNVTRHGPKPSGLALASVLATPRVDAMPAAVVEGLSGRGLAFVRDCWQRYSGWTPGTLVLLREAGQVITALEGLRGEKGEREAQRMLVQLLAALQLEK